MRFSIVSLNWNSRSILGELLEKHLNSLLTTNYDNYEIVFVDNGSVDDTVDWVRSRYKDYELLKILRLNKTYSFAKANNLALKAVDPKADIVVFINNDTIVDKNWLRGLAEVFKDPKVAIAQPLILDLATRRIQFMGGFLDPWGRTLTISGITNKKIDKMLREFIKAVRFKPLRVLWCYGACIAVRKDFIESIGGFNELFEFSLEELTICIPANTAGYKVVIAPKSIIYHKSGASVRHRKLTKCYIRNKFLLILIYYPSPIVAKSFLGRFIIEFYTSIKRKSLIDLFHALSDILFNFKIIVSSRHTAYKLQVNSPYLVKSPLLLTEKKHLELSLNKLFEINKCLGL